MWPEVWAKKTSQIMSRRGCMETAPSSCLNVGGPLGRRNAHQTCRWESLDGVNRVCSGLGEAQAACGAWDG